MATKSQSPTREDYLKVCRIAKYFRDSPGTGVLFKRNQPIKAFLYCDSSHALYPDGRGQAGLFMTLGSGYVQARTSKLKMITLSSTESEMCAMSEGATYARWLCSILKDFGYPLNAPVKMYMDNLSAIHLMTNSGAFARNKHITIRENYAREAVSDGVITIHHKRTNEMSADMLTKFRTGRGLKSNMRDAGMVYIESGGKDMQSQVKTIAPEVVRGRKVEEKVGEDKDANQPTTVSSASEESPTESAVLQPPREPMPAVLGSAKVLTKSYKKIPLKPVD